MTAPIRYARSGDVNIAYQVTGDGPFDLVLVPGFFSHLEIAREHAGYARFSGGSSRSPGSSASTSAARPLWTGTSGSRTSRRAWTTSAP